MSIVEICIGDFGEVITGNTPPKKNPEYYGSEYKFIKPTDMVIDQRFTFITEEHYSKLAFEKYKNSLIAPYSTCVVTIGSIGKKMTMTNEECFVNQAVNAVVPNKDLYDPYYVFYSLKNILAIVKSADTGASSGRENVSKSNFTSLRLKINDDINIQHKIASILSAYDDLIENNLRRIELLEESARNIYKEWFVNFHFPGYEASKFVDGLPEGWEKINLFELAEVKYGYPFKGKDFNEDGDGMPIVRIRDIPKQQLRFYTTQIAEQKFIIKRGDLLVGMDGEFHINNWANKEAYLVQRVCRIRPNNYIYNGYLSQAIIEPIKFFEQTLTGATVSHLGDKHLRTIDIVVPDAKSLSNLVIFNQLFRLKSNINR